jgi:hypothetical protein
LAFRGAGSGSGIEEKEIVGAIITIQHAISDNQHAIIEIIYAMSDNQHAISEIIYVISDNPHAITEIIYVTSDNQHAIIKIHGAIIEINEGGKSIGEGEL